jgi:hypothetical protein
VLERVGVAGRRDHAPRAEQLGALDCDLADDVAGSRHEHRLAGRERARQLSESPPRGPENAERDRQAGDAEAVQASFAADATWTLGGELPMSGTWRGRAAIVEEFLPAAMAHFSRGPCGSRSRA